VLAAIGGAAIVPTATAAAAVLVPPERRGRAIALVVLGFTLSTAVGSPLGTAIGDAAGWRVPLAVVAGGGVVLAVAVGFVVRGVPVAPPVRLVHRFTALADGRVIMALLTTVLVVAAVNACYLYSAAVTATATGGSGSLLAVLLACYGVAGILGNAITGRATDRFGNRPVATAQLAVHAVVLLLLPLALGSFAATAVLFGVWGVTAFASGVPVQHRLVEVDPANSAVLLSWFTTALYLGIAVAPVIGSSTLLVFGAGAVPEASALAVVLAALLFQLGFIRRIRPASA
jgi:predicted MFS family arabinose efflux permease